MLLAMSTLSWKSRDIYTISTVHHLRLHSIFMIHLSPLEGPRSTESRRTEEIRLVDLDLQEALIYMHRVNLVVTKRIYLANYIHRPEWHHLIQPR